MNQSNTNTKQKTFIIAILTAIVVIGAIALFRTQTTATLAIQPVGQPAVVYTDKSERRQLSSEATTTYAVGGESTEVIISASGHYPWRETVTTKAGSTTVVRPFLVPEQPRRIREISNAAQEQLARQRINPTKSATSSNGKIQLIANDNGNLIAEWLGPRGEKPGSYECQGDEGRCGVVVYSQNNQEVEQVSFYPNRSDTAVFATKSGVYAIEINPTGDTQNFQPINDSLENPRFITTDNAIVVSDGQEITISQVF